MTTTPRHDQAELTDVRVMAVIHSMYRREFRLAAGLVRQVAAGNTSRARVVADHLAWIGDHLHHHHTHEDEMLWPLMLERVPSELAPIVTLMETQHETVDQLQGQVAELLPRWRAHAQPQERDELATLFDRLYVHLVEHLDAEEQRLLPIAARSVTQAEWDAVGEASKADTPRKDMSLTLGMFQYDADPRAFASMFASAPPPVRVILPRLARRAFRKHAARVHGTPTP